MPLKDPKKAGSEWTWKQAVAWIGFDTENPPRDWDMRKQKIGGAVADQVASKAEAAIAELIDNVAGKNLTPIWKPPPSMRIGESPELFFTRRRDDTQKTLMDRLNGTLDLGGCPFAGLYFERDEVLRLWPGATKQAKQEAPAQASTALPAPTPQKRRGRNKHYDWSDIFSEFDEMIAEEGAPGPDIQGWQTHADVYRKLIEWHEEKYGDGTAPDEDYLAKKLSQKWQELKE